MLMLFPSSAIAQEAATSLADGRSGTIWFASRTPINADQYLGDFESAPVVLVSGVLSLPETSPGRLPAVVLSHSAGGVSRDRDLAWAEWLASQGIAAFVVDSFGPRGVKGFAGQPSVFATVADQFAALRLLATHPRIDPGQIVAMGLSRGGMASLYAVLDPVSRVGAPDGARFAAHIALYPDCSVRYMANRLTGAPVLMLLGGADDLAAPEPCLRHAGWLRSKGIDARAVVYPGARHLFDGTAPVNFVADGGSARKCNAEYDADTRIFRRLDLNLAVAPEQVGEYFRSCAERGVHLGGDTDARASSRAEVVTFLTSLRSR